MSIRNRLAVALIMALCATARADGIGGGIGGANGIGSGVGDPNGIASEVINLTPTPPPTCAGVVDFSVGCALPMFRGIP